MRIKILNRHIQSFRTYYGDSVYGYASLMPVNTKINTAAGYINICEKTLARLIEDLFLVIH